jgi:hypothetical protein
MKLIAQPLGRAIGNRGFAFFGRLAHVEQSSDLRIAPSSRFPRASALRSIRWDTNRES